MRTRLTAASAALILLGALGGAPAAASAAPLLPPEPPAKHRYLIETTSVAASSGASLQLRRDGGQVRRVYSRVFRGFSATMTTAQARTLRASGQVASVMLDGVVHSTSIQRNPTWGLDRIDQRKTARNRAYGYATTGAGVTAFVLDTGTRASHRQFGGRVIRGYDFVGRDRNASDCQGHGTHVSGTLGGATYGVAKRVRIVPLRVLDCEGAGNISDILEALDWAVAHKPKGPAVVNMSLSGEGYKPLDAAVERTVAAGITVVVAAGNDGVDACKTSPGRAPHAITVAATSSRDTRPSWSNYGRCVDIFAPGVDVRSASMTSRSASEVMSGTSMAAPHVTGVLARYLQVHPRATPAQARSALLGVGTRGTVRNRKGAPSRLLYASPAPTAPGRPTTVVTRRSATGKSATISWAPPGFDGGRPVTRYQVTAARTGVIAKPATTIVAATARSFTFSRLVPGARYLVSVRAFNSVGAGAEVSRTIR